MSAGWILWPLFVLVVIANVHLWNKKRSGEVERTKTLEQRKAFRLKSAFWRRSPK